MEAKCYFAKESPKVEVRGGLVFIQPIGSPCEIAVSPHTLGKFIANANRALDEIHEGCGTVVPIKARR